MTSQSGGDLILLFLRNMTASGTTSSGSSCGGLRNMYLSSSYSRFGVGYAFDSQKNLYYWYGFLFKKMMKITVNLMKRLMA